MKFYDFGETPKTNRTTGITFDGFSDKDRNIAQREPVAPPVQNFNPMNEAYNTKYLQEIDYSTKHNRSYPKIRYWFPR